MTQAKLYLKDINHILDVVKKLRRFASFVCSRCNRSRNDSYLWSTNKANAHRERKGKSAILSNNPREEQVVFAMTTTTSLTSRCLASLTTSSP